MTREPAELPSTATLTSAVDRTAAVIVVGIERKSTTSPASKVAADDVMPGPRANGFNR
jgi:hypothetical protein